MNASNKSIGISWKRRSGKRPIALRVLFYFITFALTFIILVTGIQFYMEYQRQYELVEHSFEYVKSSYVPILARLTYDMDFENLGVLLQGMLMLEGVEYVEVLEKYENSSTVFVTRGNALRDPDIIVEYRLPYEGAPEGAPAYGLVWLQGSLKGAYPILRRKAFSFFLIGSFLSLVFAAGLFMIFYYVVNRYLLEIVEYTNGLDFEGIVESENLFLRRRRSPSKTDEIDELTNAINEMRLRVDRGVRKQKETENELRATLQDRTTLLQELYHRTKNNMQVISSLLSLNIDTIRHPELKPMVEEVITKINTMSLVHEKLYQQENLYQLELSEYVTEVTELVFGAYPGITERISLEYALDPVYVSIDTALPFGLVLNELVTNALKYAFPEHRKGHIRIMLEPVNEGELLLRVSDDGIGMPDPTDLLNYSSIGIQLVRALVADQMGGRVELQNSEGVKWSITVPLKK